MVFTLSEVVPWGRSFEEYVAMFALSRTDLRKTILGCADGPAGFNSVLTSRGGTCVSVDPLYCCSTGQIQQRIRETFDVVLEQTRRNRDEFVWESIPTVEELGRMRMASMDMFLKDFDAGRAEGRYLAASLPYLPFRNRTFEIALCSHFLFLYSEQLSEQYHLASVKELCRVAAEVRIFPILELGSRQSRHLDCLVNELATNGLPYVIREVSYCFQKGGNQMLVIGGLPD